MFPLLQAAYSAKAGRPVACGQTHLIELANTLYNSHKPSLWVFSVLMRHYDRAELLLAHGNKKAWLDKVKGYREAWLNNDPTYAPDRRYDELLAFLFPGAGDELRTSPAQFVAKHRASK